MEVHLRNLGVSKVMLDIVTVYFFSFRHGLTNIDSDIVGMVFLKFCIMSYIYEWTQLK